MLTAIVLTATGIVSVFFMCMAYAANTDSKTNAYETACSVTVIAGVTIMVYFQAAHAPTPHGSLRPSVHCHAYKRHSIGLKEAH